MQMQRILNSSIFLLLIALVFEAASLPHKKIVAVEPSDEANTISKSEVGASWGGYSASAGLGGGPNGGGLHAEAGGPGLGAGAGISGTSYSTGQAGAQAGAGGAGVNYGTTHGGAGTPQGGFFDSVFNIPISVLQAVNKYLNQKGTVQVSSGQQPPKAHHAPESHYDEPTLPVSVPAKEISGSAANAGASVQAGSEGGLDTRAHVGAHASAGAGTPSGGSGVVYQKRPAHYDNVFNIPISALKSVNQLLNG